jgi:hypothetical protein
VVPTGPSCISKFDTAALRWIRRIIFPESNYATTQTDPPGH